MQIFVFGAGATLLVAALWIALSYFRGGVSTGMSKRAVAFGGLVFAEIILGALVFGVRNDALANVAHRVGAFMIIPGAAWVWLKASSMKGSVRLSANFILCLNLVAIILIILTPLVVAPEMSLVLQQITYMTLLCAAVWHAHEMRIYPASMPMTNPGSE